MKVLVCFYSLYGHVFQLASALAQGVSTVGLEPVLRTVDETLPSTVLEAMRAAPAKQRGADLPVATVADLEASSAIIFGSPTRFGGMCAQMRAFMDKSGGLWAKQALAGKIGSAFTSTATQHGGQETTLLSFHSFFLHHSMLVAGAPFGHPGLNRIDMLSGGSPYGAGTISGGDGSRQVSENELDIARAQGEFIAKLAKKLGG